MHLLSNHKSPTPIYCVTATGYEAVKASLPLSAQQHLDALSYKPKAGSIALLPGKAGRLGGVLFGVTDDGSMAGAMALGALPYALPEGAYSFSETISAPLPDKADVALAWLLGSYRFSRYKTAERAPASLVVRDAAVRARATLLADAVKFGRDLINTPANDMTPSVLAVAAKILAQGFAATCTVTAGAALLKKGFPLIHTVGRASMEEPRLVDITFGNPKHPKVTVIGKGVCFDTGGLDIKPSSGMALMKKDMGGAATALTLAQMVMTAKLKVRLRVLLPIVENAISGNAFRTSDVIKSRKGLTVEIGNTDAEGRLILADALTLACEDRPSLLIDFATLTGAARVALGADLPPFYTEDEWLADDIVDAGRVTADPVWRMPLWPAYAKMLDSKVADISSTGSGGMAGSIVAALFLKRFVDAGIPWAHFDIYGWTPSAKPGRPEGGEPQAARLVFALLEKRYG